MTSEPQVKDFILASGSPQRRALLAQMGFLPKRISPADIDESEKKYETATYFYSFTFAEECFTSNYVVKFRIILTMNVTITWMNGILKIGGLSTGLRQRNLLIIWSSISYVTQDFVQSKSLIILKTC